jgi:hypothetical protein
MKLLGQLSVCFLFLILFSCTPKNKAKPGEGTVVYHISYPDSMQYGLKKAFLPSEIILVFKNEQAAFIASGGLGMVQLVNLLDYRTKSYTSLLIDHLHGNVACKYSMDEIRKNETASNYNFYFTEDTLSIASVKCNNAYASHNGEKLFNIWYDPAIRFYYWNSPFKDFNYLMLDYTHTINGLTMHLSATEVDLKNAVDTSLFSVKGNYRWVNEKQFFDHLASL